MQGLNRSIETFLYFRGDVVCDQPLEVIDHKISLFKVKSTGKQSKTIFRRFSYNGKTSVVKCKLDISIRNKKVGSTGVLIRQVLLGFFSFVALVTQVRNMATVKC